MFDTLEIDSNSKYALNYDKVNLHNENYYSVYFKNMNVFNIENILKQLDIEVLSYIVNEEKYYANNIDELIDKVSENRNIEDKIYLNVNGFTVDGVNIICENKELIKLEKIADIY